jgi:kynurenine formamidase
MKCLQLLLLILFALPVMAQRPPAFPSGRVVDLTHPFDAGTVYWPTAQPFKLETDFEGMTDQGYYYSAYRYSAAEHGGTHLDSPVHFAKGRYTVDQIPLRQLMGAAVVVDVTNQCAANPDYQVSVADFQN